MGGKIQMFTTSSRIFTITHPLFKNSSDFTHCFTGAHDKVADDVVNRICLDNNKHLSSNNPGVKSALIALDSRMVGAQKSIVVTAVSVHHIINNFVRTTCKNFYG
jgi:hypothetical protein